MLVALEISPFPLSTKICVPSRLTIAPVGYQPVGMKPWTRLAALLLTSTTATSLSSALATSNVRPFGDNPSEFGPAVDGAPGVRLIEICSIGRPANVSYTQTVADVAHAMKIRFPSFDSCN